MISNNNEFNIYKPTEIKEIMELKNQATKKGYDLLKFIDEYNKKLSKDKYLQIATSESLTCGLIMSTLVDIPYLGYIKYGGFGVYDTDAKRVFNNVSVDNVYTHKCAYQMAVGVLKNSNATIAIAVTGNAMPLNEHVKMLGEVFIGIAGYNSDGNIIYITKAINMCDNLQNNTSIKKTCKKWYRKIVASGKKEYNPRSETANVSQKIRYMTVLTAFDLCIEFITKFNPQVPDIIIERKKINNQMINNIHNNIPSNKYEFNKSEICKNNEFGKNKSNKTYCYITQSDSRISTKEFINNNKNNNNKK